MRQRRETQGGRSGGFHVRRECPDGAPTAFEALHLPLNGITFLSEEFQDRRVQAREDKPGPSTIKRVLIYRLGSIGDTLVAMPAIRLVARAFPIAERRILTNFPIDAKAAPLETVLEGTGLVHGYMRYPIRMRSLRELEKLRVAIRTWQPDVVVNLTSWRGWLKSARDISFFRICGIRRMVGLPLPRDCREHRALEAAILFESEASRLARCISILGTVDLSDRANWDLALTHDEFRRADAILANWSPGQRFIAASIGAKADTKDWGTENWCALFARLSGREPHLGLVLVGATNERSASGHASRMWRGPALNVCGELSPRETAAVIERAAIFVGHDSGPMHLAAAVGVPCVAVFSARAKPGVWFPFGSRNRVVYHQTHCFGCQLVTCTKHQKKCIRTITVEEVHAAVVDALAGNMKRGHALT
jgi:ADP-heptose:LPS heptosyltransferase